MTRVHLPTHPVRRRARELPGELLAAAVRRNAAAPLLTAYDDATGDRVELSGATLANWVAKTANLLQDEFDVGPGSTVAVALPVHWQTAAVLLAAWSCGAAVLDTAAEDDDRLTGATVVLADRDRLPALEDALGTDPAAELLGLSLHPLGLGMTDYVGPARDFALEVRAHGDFFSPWQPADPAAPGLVTGGLTLALGGLAAAAGELAGAAGHRARATACWSTRTPPPRRGRWPGCWRRWSRGPPSCWCGTRRPTAWRTARPPSA